jgi:hypothetical protein
MSMLYNGRQMAERITTVPAVSKLEELKRQHFRPETRSERIAKALAALRAPAALKLTVEQAKDAAENPELDLED